MNRTHYFTSEIYCPALSYTSEFEFCIDYDYAPACKGSRENGVPIEPDTEAEYEFGDVHAVITPDMDSRLKILAIVQARIFNNLSPSAEKGHDCV